MARRNPSRKSRHLGHRTFGGGNTKNRRGKGCRGGKGRAGYHKHKWLQTIKRGEHKPPKKGFVSGRKTLEETTLAKIEAMPEQEIVLKNTKVLSNGNLTRSVKITATAFTAKAKEKIEAAGGQAITL